MWRTPEAVLHMDAQDLIPVGLRTAGLDSVSPGPLSTVYGRSSIKP
jgi:hypothetical protein